MLQITKELPTEFSHFELEVPCSWSPTFPAHYDDLDSAVKGAREAMKDHGGGVNLYEVNRITGWEN